MDSTPIRINLQQLFNLTYYKFIFKNKQYLRHLMRIKFIYIKEQRIITGNTNLYMTE